MNTVAVQSNLANLEHAFYVAEKIGVIRLLDPEGECLLDSYLRWRKRVLGSPLGAVK